MSMNRRNVLVGLGAIVASGGAALGTGAFSSVEANRDVTIETSADDGALLEIRGHPNYGGTASDYVTNGTAGSGTTNTTAISIGEGASSGVNENALTEFAGLLEVVNQGTQTAEFYVKDDGSSTLANSPLDFQDSSGNSLVGSSVDTSNTVNLTPNGGGAAVSVVVDLQGANSVDEIPNSVTFAAEVSGN